MKRALLIVAVLIGMMFTSAMPAHAAGKGRFGYPGHWYGGVAVTGPYPPFRANYYGQRVYGSWYGYPGYYGYFPGMPAGIGAY